jgi:bacterioferritin-associated ferredoxin
MTGSRPIRIDRCVCHARSFARLREEADRTGAGTVDELRDHVDFGEGCGYCLPYVRRMLRTGETVFTEILSPEDEPDD